MANPTTNFGWQMPTASDLVTDLPADFEVFGQAVDTALVDLKGGTTGQVLSKTTNTDMDFTWVTPQVGDITAVTAGTGLSGGGTGGDVTLSINTAVTADLTTAQTLTNKTLTSPALTTPTISTLTTNGDLLYGTGSGAIARRAIGTTGQVLTVSGGLPNWATPATPTSGLTLIARTAFSNVAGQAFDNVFTSTYKQYMVVIESISAATSSDDLLLQLRYAGPTTQASGYYGSLNFSTWNTALTTTFSANTTAMTIAASTGATSEPSTGTMYFSLVGNSNQLGCFYGQIMTGVNESQGTFGGRASASRTYTGFVLSSSSTNITGTVSIYGLATA